MSATTTPLPLPVVPPEVQAFAEEQGVTAYMPAVLEMTRRIYPTAPMQLIVTDDPEIANDRHIVIEVAVPDWDATQLVASDQQWTRDIFEHCPATHVSVFRLGWVSQL
jgi:hypothetical protein